MAFRKVRDSTGAVEIYAQRGARIRSLAYFQPVVEELLEIASTSTRPCIRIRNPQALNREHRWRDILIAGRGIRCGPMPEIGPDSSILQRTTAIHPETVSRLLHIHRAQPPPSGQMRVVESRPVEAK